MDDPIVQQSLAAEFVRLLRRCDWSLRHVYFQRIALRNENFSNCIRQQMSPDELLDGLHTGHPPRDVIPLACGVGSYFRGRIA